MLRLKTLDLYVVRHCNMDCELCSTGSSMQPAGEVASGQYIQWLLELRRRGVSWRKLNILGGEPTLHSGLLHLCQGLKLYGPLEMTTNGTWLDNWQRLAPVLSVLDILTVSGYPSVVESVDGYADRIREVREAFPRLEVRDIRVKRFLEWGFRADRAPDSEVGFCHGWGCAWLSPDGRLARCWAALHLGINPAVTDGFREACKDGMFYDLIRDTGDIREWYGRRPFPACSWCTGGRRKWQRQRQRP